MFVKSIPDVGQTVLSETDQIDIDVYFDAYRISRDSTFQAELWWGFDTHNHWKSTELELTEFLNYNLARFKAHLPVPDFPDALNFTVRYRYQQTEPWSWQSKDGNCRILHKSTKKPIASDLFYDLQLPLAELESPLSSSENCFWSIPRCATTRSVSVIGRVFECKQTDVFDKFFAFESACLPDVALPENHTGYALVVFQRLDGRFLVIWPICNLSASTVSCVFLTENKTCLNIATNAQADHQVPLVLIASGFDIHSLINEILLLLRREPFASPQINEDDDYECINWYEGWYDGLGFCSGSLSEDRLSLGNAILDDLQSLGKTGNQVTWLLIDYQWQIKSQHGLVSFKSDPALINDGLKSLVKMLHEHFPNLKHIGVAHSIMGSPVGVALEGEVANDYGTFCTPKGFSLILPDSIERFYRDFYEYLYECGITFVKVYDHERLYESSCSLEIVRTYEHALKKSAVRYFYNRVLYSFSNFPFFLVQELFLNPGCPNPLLELSNELSNDSSLSLSLDSDAVTRKNLMLTLIGGYLDAVMAFDAVCLQENEFLDVQVISRLISSAPISIGNVDAHYYFKSTLPDLMFSGLNGSSVVSRLQGISQPVNLISANKNSDSDFFLAVNYDSHKNHVVLAMFNFSDDCFTNIIDLSSISEQFLGCRQCVARMHDSGQIVDLGHNIKYPFSLRPRSATLVTIVPRVHGIGLFGLVGNSIPDISAGVSFIVSSHICVKPNGTLQIELVTRALGIIQIYAKNIHEKGVNSVLGMIEDEVLPLKAFSYEQNCLYVDLQMACELLEIQRPWTNELSLFLRLSV
ncbi:hypothetical protein CANCADRAFT_84856 [Tortispora caseinolytica NRRL Y-17796]|uniref:Alpha-galactosidase n=1 Tax=Tortispora caseinolytica NRRL Y-17796 TaxID=767744 RepID=A0A1E4TKQ0_9ASCO|nr:hypothetical protein CANCADRAFT_84856 [Tortispora caseinolytica NRRL Y-17796]